MALILLGSLTSGMAIPVVQDHLQVQEHKHSSTTSHPAGAPGALVSACTRLHTSTSAPAASIIK